MTTDPEPWHQADGNGGSQHLAIAPALPFYGPVKLIQTSWNSQGAILPYVLHGLLAAGLLLALAMVLWSRGSAVRPPGTAANVSTSGG